jgi:uncharacterized membrane protein YtjA (UPF0391 family)
LSKSAAPQPRRAPVHAGRFSRREQTKGRNVRRAKYSLPADGLEDSDGVEDQMTLLKWALIFFVVSVIAGILGFTGISAASADIARFLFYVFVVIFLVLLVLGLTIFRV